MKNLFKKALLAFFALAIISCSDDDDTTFVQPEFSIADIVATSPDFSLLLAAVQKAELAATLAGEGTFTVFAPNNAAFTEYLDGRTLDDFSKEQITELLLNHVLGTVQSSSDLTTTYISTLATGPADGQNISMYINTSSGVKINNIATVTQADVEASNGIIHAVDKVIPLPNLLTFVAADSDLTTLATVATPYQGIVDALSGDDNLTLLAPDNAAFAAIDLSGASDEAITQTLLNHVVAGVNVSTALSTDYVNTLATYGSTPNNLSLYINTDNGVRFNGISDVSKADIIATNGVIHKVDAVITLPTVVTFATADPNFSTLVTALTELTPSVDFVTTLSTPLGTSPAPFTVFAPLNSAFDALDAIPDEAGLIPVLQYHVVGGANVRSSDLTDGQVVEPLLENSSFTINTMTGVTITDENDRVTNVVVPDVQAANGVIHVVDQVLLPSN